MQGVLTFLATAAGATFQVGFVGGLIPYGGEPPCFFQNGPAPAPTLEQRLAAAGVPEFSEAFGMEVAETPEVLRRDMGYGPAGPNRYRAPTP